MSAAFIEIVRFCETCRHWKSELSRYENPDAPDRIGSCERTRWNGDFPEDETTKANAFATDGGDAVLFTHRDFGCIQHEDKP